MNFGTQEPIYLQIAHYIIDNVLGKVMVASDRIKSVRDMASDIEVNPNTVARTYSLLSDMNIIKNKRGIGYFIHEDALINAKTYRKNNLLIKELPALFKTLDLLDMTTDDLKPLYNKNKDNEAK